MNKLFIILALITAPFLSLANIFTDGTVNTVSPKIDNGWSATCGSTATGDIETFFQGELPSSITERIDSCASFLSINAYSSTIYNCPGSLVLQSVDSVIATPGSGGLSVEWTCGPNDPYPSDRKGSFPVTATFVVASSSTSCPSNSFPTYTYPVDIDGDGEADSCADPNQINLNDSCNVSSGNTVLNIQVTEPIGCFSQSDGSICEYRSVDVGNGQQVYEMNLEGDCYSRIWPVLDDNGLIGQLPTNSSCVDNGGLLSCPEDPETMCPNGECYQGCGYVNDQFMCFDIDTDNDGLPDYNDPDIDGDGIANGDDLDADGDGQDDPLNGDSGLDGQGDVTVNVDLQPVVDGLGDIEGILKGEGLLTPSNGSFDIASAESELLEVQTSYKNKLQSIKSEASSIVPQMSSSGGSFSSCHKLIQFNGKTEERCIDSYSDEMSIVSVAIFFIFTALSGFIVLRGVTSRD